MIGFEQIKTIFSTFVDGFWTVEEGALAADLITNLHSTLESLDVSYLLCMILSTRIKDAGTAIRHSGERILFYTAGSRNGLKGVDIGGR